MQNLNQDYVVVLYVTDPDNDKFIFEKIKQHFAHCVSCRNLKDLCRLLIHKGKPKICLMTGDSFEASMLNYYRALDAVQDREVCDHKVVSLIPLKSEMDAFDAHRCNAIDDYLVARPLYEANRIVLIIEHLLIELGIALPNMRKAPMSQRLKNNTSDEFNILMEKLIKSREDLEAQFKVSLEEIDKCLDQADKKIQQHQAVSLDIEQLQKTLAQIKSDEVRPVLLRLQQKAMKLLDKTLEKESQDKSDSKAPPEDSQTEPEFNRLYQQDVDTQDILSKTERTPKVLIVEDDAISQQLTMKLLRGFHFKTDIAVSGRRALASLSSVKYDLILMDINLPDTNGLFLVSQTQMQGHINFKTPIIMLTGNKQKATVEEALKNGAKGYVVKPLTSKTVKQIIEKHLN
jgi:CheY-like chemotaxis protein